MKNKFRIITVVCILSVVFVGAVYRYFKSNIAPHRSELTLASLRIKVRSELGRVHSRHVNPESFFAVNTKASPLKQPVYAWRDVSVLLNGKNIHLTDSEIALLQTRYTELVLDRETIELAIAKRQKIDATKILITIPPYASAGTDLYADFIRDVTADFGVSRADQVLDAVDDTIFANNFGLGQQPQSILAEDQGDLLKISRGRTGVSATLDGKTVILPEVSGTGLYDKTQLNDFTYLGPLLVFSN